MLFGWMSERIGRSVRSRLFKANIMKDVTFFDTRSKGDLISRISSDTNIIQEGLSNNVAMVVQLATFSIVVIVIMATISWICTVSAIALIIPGALVIPCYNRKNSVVMKELQSAKAKSNGLAEERMGNVRTVKAFADEEESTEKFVATNAAIY